MSNLIEFKYDLDMYPGYNPRPIRLKQYSDSFSLVFKLHASKGELDIDSSTTAAIRGLKPDGNAYSNDCTIDTVSGTVTVAGDVQITAAAGEGRYEIILYNDDKELGTASFIIDVERAALDQDAIPSESVIREIYNIAETAEAIAASALDTEAYSCGTRDGVPVSSDDPAYHNNAKYYAEEAERLYDGDIDPDDLGFEQDPETLTVYPTYKGNAGSSGINLNYPDIPRDKVAADVEASLAKADSAMQPSVYDTINRRTDVFEYAKGQADAIKANHITPLADEVHAALVIENGENENPTIYPTLAQAVNGVLGKAKVYTDARLVDYQAYTQVIVNSLPLVGEARTFYLVPKSGGKYDKWWWITDAQGNGMWDVFGSATTLVLNALPQTGDEDTDYIIGSGNDYQYYKYINGAWKLIAGANAEVYTTEKTISIIGHGTPRSNNIEADGTKGNYLNINDLRIYHDEGEWGWVVDQPPTFNITPSTAKDYYIQFGTDSPYLHFRYDGSKYFQIGINAYSRAEVDDIRSALQFAITGNANATAANTQNITSLSNTIDRVARDLANFNTEGRSYRMELSTEDQTNYILTLYETEDGVESINSQFLLPATGGGGGSTSETTILVVDKITESPVIGTPTDSIILEVDYSSEFTDHEPADGTYVLKRGSAQIGHGNMVQGRNSFDVTEYCTVGTQKITLTVTDEGGSISMKSWTVQIADVRLESGFNDRVAYPVGSAVNFTYTPYGSVPKTMHIKFDGVELTPVTTSASGTLQSYTIPAQPHGAHLLECWITATINSRTIETDHIYRDIIWFDEDSTVPVIGCVYRYDHFGDVTTKQYSTTAIPYVVYDPRTSSPSVSLSIDGDLHNALRLTNPSNTWAYKSEDAEPHVLTITCGVTSVEVHMDIQELGYDIEPVTANLEFDFNPVGRSNAGANRLWEDADHPSVKLSVSENFDWDNGGYQLDENGNQYFCVKAGTRAQISYELFRRDPKQAGSEFKVIFKTVNVRDNTTTFLSCIPENETPVGLRMDAHQALIYTSTDSLFMPYSEEDVIEFEYNINTLDTEDSSATSYIMTYEDGVAARPLIYNDTHRLYQYQAVPITIGSDDCDVHIYRMKAYSSALSDTNVLANFIADALDSETMVARYERNQIYDENNELTPESVAFACPDLKILKIEAPHFTNDKKDYVKYTNVECIHKNGDPILDNWKYVNGYHAGQGTTSNEYGFAGRNIDIIFGFDGEHQVVSKIPLDADYITELTLGDGTTIRDGSGKVELTRTSIPNNWFNIKVNIASSENANNALLQKRYNDFLPYRTPAMRRDAKIKNSMEFVNCVIFVKESDPDVSTHREFQDTGWHFYGIGNLGDSKKTDNTRVNDPTDLAEFVVEVSDNTLPNSIFPTGVYLDANDAITYDPAEGVSMVYPITQVQWENPANLKRASLYNEWDETFEFRYDMGTKDGETISSAEIEEQQETSKQVWRNMYEFVITSSDSDFVAHFGDWFITESPLYWYLFTERYTMIDNRAKNSFWHWGKTYITNEDAQEMGDDAQYYTIDDAKAAINNGYRFDLWDYDNDTALGINNSGELKMTYGHEDIDYKTDGVPSSGFIYNAAESVFWRRIRKLMHSQLQSMYLSRESANCWLASSLIAEFDAWQEEFPEELWRLDIERKYLRTYQAGTVRFLKEMMNGRKRYQRRQFERDQEAYIGTKYIGTNVTADQIMFRCNTPQSGVVVQPDYTLRIIPYSDMYLTVRYGNSPNPQQIRAKAGQEYEITTSLTEMDDTAILIYCASRIQALNDLSACYIHDNDFSKASKLKTLIIGSTVEGYRNTFLENLNMGNNTLLETLDVRNCPNLTGSINLSACINLENLYAEGTAISSATFARNGKVKKAHFPETVSTLSFLNLNYLADLIVPSYDSLETLICEYSNINALGILQEAIDTLQTVRILGIDWQLADTTILNALLAMNSSLLSGEAYISGSIRNKEIAEYQERWPDLEVTYDAQNLVTQYQVTFINYNGDILYTSYVDRGTTPVDPVAAGIIDAPTKASDAQYAYSYSGWDDIESTVLSAKTITAQYTSTIRTYTVRWYARIGLLLETQTKHYGEEAVFTGILPTNTEEESSFVYNLFAGWDKSTGYITGDIDVYAVWERAELPVSGTDLSAMSRAEIFAVCTAGRAASYFEDKDHFDMTLGWDFNYSNVASSVILENRFFDGTQCLDTGIKLFDADAESFTLAIDYEFLDTTENGGTLVSCFEESGSEGFRLKRSAHPYIQWGDREVQCGADDNRGMVVLRHQKGSTHLFVYIFNRTANQYDLELMTAELVRTRNTQADSVLTFGAIRFLADGAHDYYGKGWIHWCKIWYGDLGDADARRLASWTHDALRMEFAGADRYRLAGQTSAKANGSFFANNLLRMLRRMNPTNTNEGGWDESEGRTFLNTRVWAALDYGWKSIIKQVKIYASAGNQSTEILTSEDYLYLAANREVGGYTTAPYVNEGTAISWFTTNASRIKFSDVIRYDTAQIIAEDTDPTMLTSYTVHEGDIWINTSNSSIGFIYIPAEKVSKHTTIGCRKVSSSDNILASDGGLWLRATWYFERSAVASSSLSFYVVATNGNPYYNGSASGWGGVGLGFSI